MMNRAQVMTPKAKKNANAALQEVENHIKIDDREKKAMVEKIDKFVQKEVIGKLKEESPVFKALYRNIYFTGSYFDGLRVKDAKEFDLNLVLAYPQAERKVNIDFDKKEPGFAKMRLENELPAKISQIQEVEKLFRKHFGEMDKGTFYMSRDKPYRYLQGLVQKIQPKLQNLSAYGVKEVKFRTSGPAINLIVTTLEGDEIDVDLVIAFIFPIDMIKAETAIYKELQRSRKFFKANDEFFLVPKKPKSFFKTTEPSKFSWRLDFHDYERRVLKDAGCIKPVIRLLKYYRDCNGPLKTLSSYSLKTVVMHMRRNDPDKKWLKEQQADLFLEALKHLKKMLDDGSIPYLFDPRSNVLWGMSPKEKDNKANFLKAKIKDLDEAKNTDRCYDVWTGAFSDPLANQMAGMKL